MEAIKLYQHILHEQRFFLFQTLHKFIFTNLCFYNKLNLKKKFRIADLWARETVGGFQHRNLKWECYRYRFKSNCRLVEPGTIGGMPFAGVFLRDSNGYFREKHGKLQTFRSTSDVLRYPEYNFDAFEKNLSAYA